MINLNKIFQSILAVKWSLCISSQLIYEKICNYVFLSFAKETRNVYANFHGLNTFVKRTLRGRRFQIS